MPAASRVCMNCSNAAFESHRSITWNPSPAHHARWNFAPSGTFVSQFTSPRTCSYCCFVISGQCMLMTVAIAVSSHRTYGAAGPADVGTHPTSGKPPRVRLLDLRRHLPPDPQRLLQLGGV